MALGEIPVEGNEQFSITPANSENPEARKSPVVSQAKPAAAHGKAESGLLPEEDRPTVMAASGEVLEVVADSERCQPCNAEAQEGDEDDEDEDEHFNFLEEDNKEPAEAAGSKAAQAPQQSGQAPGPADAWLQGRSEGGSEPAQKGAADARIAAVQRGGSTHPVAAALEKWQSMDSKGRRAVSDSRDSARDVAHRRR
jgi:hypothetical protein